MFDRALTVSDRGGGCQRIISKKKPAVEAGFAMLAVRSGQSTGSAKVAKFFMVVYSGGLSEWASYSGRPVNSESAEHGTTLADSGTPT